MILRDYQQECVNTIWNDMFTSNRVLISLPTGSGKSVIFQKLIEKSIEKKPDIKIIILFNRVKLLKQIHERLSQYIPGIGIYCSSLNRFDDTNIIVASIQSMPHDKFFNLIIFDETHNLNDNEGKYIDFISSAMSKNENIKMVGFTATPFRNDGYIFGEGKFWPKINYTKSILYMINKGYLVRPVCLQPDYLIDTSKLRITAGEYNQSDISQITSDEEYAKEQVIDALNRSIGRKKTIWFCSNIKHCELVKKILLSFGEWAVSVHSNLDDDQQNDDLDLFMKNDEVKHLTFVSIVSEGFDYPPIDCVVLLRPTRSPVMMIQTIGRALRPSEGKENALILDYAQVVKELGPLTNPVVKKQNKTAKKEQEKKPTQKVCKNCRAIVPIKEKICPNCNVEFGQGTQSGNLFADENADLLGETVKKIDVSWISIANHTSKSGNSCIKISYYSKDILQKPVCEFIAHTFSKGKKMLQTRSAELLIENGKATRIPKSITYIMDNGYPRIKSFEWE